MISWQESIIMLTWEMTDYKFYVHFYIINQEISLAIIHFILIADINIALLVRLRN